MLFNTQHGQHRILQQEVPSIINFHVPLSRPSSYFVLSQLAHGNTGNVQKRYQICATQHMLIRLPSSSSPVLHVACSLRGNSGRKVLERVRTTVLGQLKMNHSCKSNRINQGNDDSSGHNRKALEKTMGKIVVMSFLIDPLIKEHWNLR